MVPHNIYQVPWYCCSSSWRCSCSSVRVARHESGIVFSFLASRLAFASRPSRHVMSILSASHFVRFYSLERPRSGAPCTKIRNTSKNTHMNRTECVPATNSSTSTVQRTRYQVCYMELATCYVPTRYLVDICDDP